jgi:uncharacterized MnhB-related membrane protein
MIHAMRSHVFEVGSLVVYAVAILFLYRAVAFLAERDYVAALLGAGVGLAVARLAGDLMRFAMWRAWVDEQRDTNEDVEP